jgi:hypothetical protein
VRGLRVRFHTIRALRRSRHCNRNEFS